MKPEDPLVSLESDKATMDVPAPAAGHGQGAQGQGRRQGERRQRDPAARRRERARRRRQPAAAPKTAVSAPPSPTSAPGGVAEVRVPDIGDFKDVPVIEIMVKPGDTVKAEDPLVSLESDKATMDVPAPLGGTVQDIKVKVGDKVSEGAVVLTLSTGSGAAAAPSAPAPAAAAPHRGSAPRLPRRPAAPRGAGRRHRRGRVRRSPTRVPACASSRANSGVDLGRVKGSGDKGRILKEDVESFAKGAPAAAKAAAARHGRRRRRRHRSPAVAEGRLHQVRRRSKPSRCRGSRRFPARTCTATG